MGNLFSKLWGLWVIGMWVAVSAPALAVTSNAPYYATPSWDQKLDVSTRFVVLSNWNNEAVLDRESGLVWERSPQTFRAEYREARELCMYSTAGKRRGWRLPSIHELGTLIEADSAKSDGFGLPAGHPFTNVQLWFYWSATRVMLEPDFDPKIWSMLWGSVYTVPSPNEGFGGGNNYWCVRGPMNTDQY